MTFETKRFGATTIGSPFSLCGSIRSLDGLYDLEKKFSQRNDNLFNNSLQASLPRKSCLKIRYFAVLLSVLVKVVANGKWPLKFSNSKKS